MAASNGLRVARPGRVERNLKRLECYQPAVDDVDPAWSAGVW